MTLSLWLAEVTLESISNGIALAILGMVALVTIWGWAIIEALDEIREVLKEKKP